MHAIDTETGSLRLAEQSESIGPGLTHAAFLKCEIGQSAHSLVSNGVWQSYSIKALLVGNTPFHISVWYEGEKLYRISLVCAETKFGTSWNDWSVEMEMKRKSAHDRWLDEQLPKGLRSFKWGDVASIYDDRSGASRIEINYSSTTKSYSSA